VKDAFYVTPWQGSRGFCRGPKSRTHYIARNNIRLQASSGLQKSQESAQRSAYLSNRCRGHGGCARLHERVDISQLDLSWRSRSPTQMLKKPFQGMKIIFDSNLCDAVVRSPICGELTQQWRQRWLGPLFLPPWHRVSQGPQAACPGTNRTSRSLVEKQRTLVSL
jgi:hypothetical protein